MTSEQSAEEVVQRIVPNLQGVVSSADGKAHCEGDKALPDLVGRRLDILNLRVYTA